jgi:hypothetical protein
MPDKKKSPTKKAKSNDQDDADSILEAKEILLDPVKDSEVGVEDPEEDVDDPGSTNKPATAVGTNIVQNNSGNVKKIEKPPHKIMHTCIMNKCSDVKGPTANKSCTKKRPLEIPVTEILSHYFLHYREQGHWSKVVPPTKPEDKLRIESFSCNLCSQRFRCNREKSDPEPARASFLYHYAIHHGKIINTIQEDPDLDPEKAEEVIKIIYKYNPDSRNFIDKGTETSFDKEPFTIHEHCEWKLKQMQNGTIPIPHNYPRSMEAPLKCPFGDRDDCKDKSNIGANNLKLHLFHHYLDFWKERVPELTGTEYKCQECGKRLNAQNVNALRTTIICHRAITHEELKEAIEESIAEFDQDLFNKLFNPHLAPKPKAIIYSRSSTNGAGSSVPTTTFYKPNVISNQTLLQESARTIYLNSNKDKTKTTPLQKKKSNKRKKRTKGLSDSEKDTSSSDSDVEKVIPQQPYVRKRIKQNLLNIDFEEDSDKDSDWEEKAKKKNGTSIQSLGPRPSRSSAKKKKTYVESGSE